MPFDFGDVVLVPFPFTNQMASKKRPAVIVSNTSYNAQKPDVILMPNTSQLRPNVNFGEIWLANWQANGLLKPSAIKPVFATIELRLVLRHLGRLDVSDLVSLRIAIGTILG